MIEVIVGVGGILNEIFDEEVINPEDKLCSAGVMSEQAWGGSGFGVTGKSEMTHEVFVCDAAGLREAVQAFEDLP
jgi:hypothetical protein